MNQAVGPYQTPNLLEFLSEASQPHELEEINV